MYTINLNISGTNRPSIRMLQCRAHWTDFGEICYWLLQ